MMNFITINLLLQLCNCKTANRIQSGFNIISQHRLVTSVSLTLNDSPLNILICDKVAQMMGAELVWPQQALVNTAGGNVRQTRRQCPANLRQKANNYDYSGTELSRGYSCFIDFSRRFMEREFRVKTLINESFVGGNKSF